MIEYIHDIIRASAGETITIGAKLIDDGYTVIDGECYLMLFDGDTMISKVAGAYNSNKEEWDFILDTNNLRGKYWYSVYKGKSSLSFKKPIYIV